MLTYSDTLEMCDRILSIFSAEKPSGENESGIVLLLGLQRGTKEMGLLTPAIQRLEEDKHLVKYGHHNDIFKIGSKTLEFKESGGYKEWVNIENRKEELKIALEELGVKTNKNVIDTGESVQKLNKILKPATKAQVFTGIVTVLVAALAAWISWLSYKRQDSNDDLKKRLKTLETEVQKMRENTGKKSHTTDSLPVIPRDSVSD